MSCNCANTQTSNQACNNCNTCTTSNRCITCNSCTSSSTSTCTSTSTTETCNCPIKLNAICVLYQGEELTTLQVDSGENLEQILIKINNYLDNLSNLYTNIGTGEGLFKQINTLNQAEFKSIRSSNSSITVTGNDDDIDIVVNPAVVTGETNTASNIGGGIEVFKQKTGVNFELRTIVGSGATTVTQVGDTVQIASTDNNTTYTGSNLGGGSEIFKQLNATDFEHRTIVAGTGINVTTVGDTVQIATSGSAPIEQIERTASFSLDDTMNNQVIFLDNTSDINITVPNTLADNFKVGFVRTNTGEVSMVAGGGAVINTKGGLRIQGQNYQAFLQKRNSNDEFYFLGNTKV